MPDDPKETTYPFSVTFDYSGHDTFQDLARAMESFSEASKAYAKSKKASLKIVGFDIGSLQCNLAANQEAWVGIQVMSQDLEDLQRGRRSALMPDSARRNLKRALEHVSAIRMTVDNRAVSVDSGSTRLLDEPSSTDARQKIAHAGVLDRVDLKANAFRIMLPHGEHITCSPALPFVDAISEALRAEVPRLSVIGLGSYRKTDLLPNTIRAETVSVPKERPGLRALISEVAQKLDWAEVSAALAANESAAEAKVSAFYPEED